MSRSLQSTVHKKSGFVVANHNKNNLIVNFLSKDFSYDDEHSDLFIAVLISRLSITFNVLFS